MKKETLVVDGNGSDKLDFTYIDDLISGVCLTIQNSNARNEIFNLTYGSSRSILDLVNLVKQELSDVKVEFKAPDDPKPIRGTLSVEKAKNLLNYEPQNPIELGLRKYINWYSEVFDEL